MERPKRPYSIQKRPTNRPAKHVYYVKFRDPESGLYRTAVSSGQSSKAAAMNWADQKIKSGVVAVPRRRTFLVEEIAKDFWDYDRSPYIQGKLARGGTMSRGHASISAGHIRKYVLPKFGKRPIASIQPAELERWVLSLGEESGMNSASVNRVYTAFRVILRESLRLGLIERDPTEKVRLLAEKPEAKGILTPTEVKRLFLGDALASYWGGSVDCYAANMLAAATGMRLGEIRGLLVEHVHEDRIEVLHSWEEGYGMKGAKWGSERMVPIPNSVYSMLASLWKHRSIGSEGFVFSRHGGAKPVYAELIPSALFSALEAMGLKAAEYKSRNITFHSWRHFFNSLCRGSVDDSKLRLVTGHKTPEMTERYTHALEEDFHGVREVQLKLFDGSNLQRAAT